MTPIVSRASKDYVLQVTGAAAGEIIVYAARDGIVCLSYTGLESIEGIPSGQWLACRLAGTPDTSRRSLGYALQQLTLALNAAAVDLDAAFDLHITGWQGLGNRVRPISACLMKDRGKAGFSIEYLPRYWYLKRGSLGSDGRRGYTFNVTAAPDTHICREQLQRVVSRLRNRQPDDAQQILAGVVGQMSGKPHAIGILLSRPPGSQVRIQYLAPRVDSVISPWLIGPGILREPRIQPTDLDLRLGAYPVSMAGSGS